jgi:hypothetical protein
MASMRGSKTTAIGLFVDGLQVKLAKLSIKKGKVVLDELRSATLVNKIEERKVSDMSVETISDSNEAFALPTVDPSSDSAGDNNSVMLGLLSQYPVAKYALTYAVSEPSIYYHVFESDFGLKGKKLKLRLLDELKNVRAIQPALDAVDHFPTVEKNLVCIVREDGLSMLRALEEVKPFIGNRLPKIPLIESSDIALMNLTRANYGFAPDEISAIIYVGVEFTRLIFMKGTEFFHFAPVIGEGYDSSNIQNTVYSRLLLEQDNMGIPRIDKILLAGESHRIKFDEFIREQLVDVEVQYLFTPYLDTSNLTPEMQEQIPEYAIAIGAAWKVLDDDHPAFYPINLLPDDVREGQKTFKLAWHGYVLLGLIFLSTIYFTTRFNSMSTEVSKRNYTLAQLEEKMGENDKIKAAISELNDQIGRYNTALAVYDSLVPETQRWNKSIEHLTKGIDDLNSIWITEVRAGGNGSMNIQGFTLYRSRIPRIAALFENATLAKVEVKEIRENTTPAYNFIINVPPQKMSAQGAPPVSTEPIKQ